MDSNTEMMKAATQELATVSEAVGRRKERARIVAYLRTNFHPALHTPNFMNGIAAAIAGIQQLPESEVEL